MNSLHSQARRGFLVRAGAVCSALAIPGVSAIRLVPEESKDEESKDEAEEISPAEDLMREDGVLNRILLIYEEHRRRLEAKQDFDPALLLEAAGMIRQFVEDYHEKLGEDYLFPRFRKAGKHVDLVDTLLQQHRAGRRLTADIQQLAVAGTRKDDSKRRQLSDTLHSFIRMYRPHEAREDTVLFPAFRKVVSPSNTVRWARNLKRKKTSSSEKRGSSKSWGRLPDWRTSLGSMNWPSSRPSNRPAGSVMSHILL